MNLNTIIYYICAVISLANMLIIVARFSGKKYNRNGWMVLECLFGAVILTLLNYINMLMIRMILSVIAIIVMCVLNIKQSFKKNAFYSCFVWCFGMLFDFIFMLIFSLIYELLPDFVIPMEYSLTVVLQIAINLLSRIKIFKTIARKMYNFYSKINVLVFVVVVIVMLYFGAKSVMNITKSDQVTSLLITCTFGVALLILLPYIKYLKKVNKEALQIMAKNNKHYIDQNNELRKYKHNIHHKLSLIKSYGNERITRIINEIEKESGSIVDPKVNLEKLPVGINGFISDKIFKYTSNNLSVTVDNYLTKDLFDLISSKDYISLCDALGVSLDNALEAASNSKDKMIYMNFYESEEEILIMIENSFSNNLDIDKLGTVNYSTKKIKSGIGLFSILNRNRVVTNVRVKENNFITTISVYKEGYEK